ncbi:hypothetical protein HG536_0C01280 [Torulaspora globosa]|uniref:Choline kinase N-terminal domain-containing protein n=1 Tax=Torulaspora globosa TaxID=48254 RepID=A0A7G3ZEM4_9SACH|nr:uncharacterized protein HG536_0C01280 [Torulaspora globosa]QLL31960.1 hypothetical protein HG536_0C01280 [Torulaspora globosa]
MSETRSSRAETRRTSFTVGNPKSRSHSRSSSKGRRPSLSSLRSSHRLIRTISIDSDLSKGEDDSRSETYSAGTESTETTAAEYDSVASEVQELRLDSRGSASTRNAGPKVSNEIVEVPFVNVTLDNSLPQDYLKDDILNTIQSLKIPKWYVRGAMDVSPLDRRRLKLTKITGAMTNAIYKLGYPNLPSLLLRVYGRNNSLIIDREYELEVLARLSLRHIGPSLFGCFENGRFEQYLENAQTLGKNDIRDWKTSQRIARRMKELHKGVPLTRQERDEGPACWAKINHWIRVIEMAGRDWVQDDENIKHTLLCNSWSDFKAVVQRYRDWLYSDGSASVKSSLVFCHNDAQYGNLLFTSPVINAENPVHSTVKASSSSSLFPLDSNVSIEQIINPPIQEQSQDSKLVVIDFEYAGANPAAFDLANHLSEWMHDYNCSEPYRCDPLDFPTKEQMLNFVYSYVSHLRGNSTKPIDDEVKCYYNAILKWRGSVQIFWSLWAILQSGHLHEEKLERTESFGPSGNKYIINTASPEEEDVIDKQFADMDGVDIDSFDYISYCREKIAVFWGDALQFGVAQEEDCAAPEAKFLNIEKL